MSTQSAAKSGLLNYVKTIGIVNNGDNGRGFANPYDTAISKDGRIFVLNRCDPARRNAIRIGICTMDEQYLGEFGHGYGDGDGQMIWPVAMAFDSEERLYISDEYNNRISIFDTEGNFLGQWGSEGTDDGQFNLPWGITVDSNGNVYVADWRNDRIQKFSADGKFITSFGDSGEGDGQFHRPSGVTVDSDGNIYVADWGNERIQVLGPDGAFKQLLRGEATVSKWAEDYFAANPDEVKVREIANMTPELPPHLNTPYQISSQVEPYFWGPVSVTLDSDGRLYVVETNRHRLQIYQKS